MIEALSNEQFENARRYGDLMRAGTIQPLELVAAQGGVFIGILVAEIERLRPYEAELRRIAEDVGEPDDPFAAWESIAANPSNEGAGTLSRDNLTTKGE